ncbi:hypothetical protein ACP70R_037296 [Stipagrostis hirtigluma subsp. patula]
MAAAPKPKPHRVPLPPYPVMILEAIDSCGKKGSDEPAITAYLT